MNDLFAAFDEAYAALRLHKANRDSAKALFDAGVAAERERCAILVENWHNPQRDDEQEIAAYIRKDPE